MLDYIKGKLVSKQTAGAKGATIVVENNNVGYLIMRQAKERHESRGLHYSIDYPPAPHKEISFDK